MPTSQEKNKSYVYIHKNKISGEIFYVGIGSTKKYKRAYSSRNRNKWWVNIVNKYGFDVEIIEYGISFKEAKRKEKTLIKLYGRKDLGKGSLINMTDGGDGVQNLTQESRSKISFKNKGKSGLKGKENPMYGRIGKLNPMYGKTHSSSTRIKISKGVLKYNETHNNPMLNKRHTEKTKLKISNSKRGGTSWSKGQKFSTEHIEKLKGPRESMSRGNHPESKIVLHIYSGIFYDCIKDASEVYNINYSTLKLWLRKGTCRFLKIV